MEYLGIRLSYTYPSPVQNIIFTPILDWSWWKLAGWQFSLLHFMVRQVPRDLLFLFYYQWKNPSIIVQQHDQGASIWCTHEVCTQTYLTYFKGRADISTGNIGISALFFNIGISVIGKHFYCRYLNIGIWRHIGKISARIFPELLWLWNKDGNK